MGMMQMSKKMHERFWKQKSIFNPGSGVKRVPSCVSPDMARCCYFAISMWTAKGGGLGDTIKKNEVTLLLLNA